MNMTMRDANSKDSRIISYHFLPLDLVGLHIHYTIIMVVEDIKTTIINPVILNNSLFMKIAAKNNFLWNDGIPD